ncbi:P-loop containing nucleoside triphosphate hydrolase protein [Xylariales sp. PMI_506]|nr:P-loop containing nucleoside triphosphate hydrolase protein [Xylariales sp. PMI_506]
MCHASTHVSALRWLSSSSTQARTPQPSSQVQLRDYQEQCIQSVLASLGNGHKRLGISLATGAGKTIIFTQLIDRIKPSPGDGTQTQTLILAHRRELVEQAARHCTTAYPGKTVDIEMGNMHASGHAEITVASVRSITSGDRLSKFDPKRFKLVLVDEAHHIVAPGYMRTLEHFGLDQKRVDSPALVGVSATFSRFDGLRLGAAIDEIVYHKDYIDMIQDKWLSDAIFTTVESTADMSKIRNGPKGDFRADELSHAVNTEEVNEITVRSWLAKARGRKSTLVFCVDIAHVAGLTQVFRSRGIDARLVTSETPTLERSERLSAFKNREFPVLVNCGVFTEGTDIPNIDCILLARPTRSRNLLIQMIGRGMRLYPGKINCHIIDMVASLQTGVVTTPTLFGLDPGELVDEASSEEMRDLKARKELQEEQLAEAYPESGERIFNGHMGGSVTFTEYDSVLDLISDTSGEKHIRSISQYAWVQIGPDRYILPTTAGAYVRLEKGPEANGLEPLYEAWEIRALPPGVSKSPYAAPRKLLTAVTFIDAVHGSDKYVSEKYPNNLLYTRHRRRSDPATPNQIKILNKMRLQGDELSPTDITMGQASDMITKWKHGARGRFALIVADKRKKERQILKAEQDKMRSRAEQISVGPLME